MSDSFGKAECSGVGKDEVEIKTLLDGIDRLCHYNWDKHGRIIEFRDRSWFAKRSAQIPEAWIEPWRREFVKTGTLDIGNLAQIAALTLEQVNINIAGDEILCCSNQQEQSVLSTIGRNQDILRTYAAMSTDERAAVFSDGGLDLAGIEPNHRAEIAKPISRGPFNGDPSAQIVVVGERAAQGKQFCTTSRRQTAKAAR